MTTETGSPAGGEAFHSVELPADAPETFRTPSEAAAYFTSLLETPAKEQPAESAEPATAEKELPDEGNADPETAPSEEPEGSDPEAEKLPPIERPRSWSKDDDDDWNALPRTRQEKIAANERAREADIRQRINDAAEKLKSLTAKEQQAEQARQEMEAKAKAYVQAVSESGPFADIRTMQDLEKLQAEDPFRFQAYQLHVWKTQGARDDLAKLEQQKAQEKQSKRNAYEAEQNKLLVELVPEMADPKKAGELRERAIAMLNDDLGLKTDLLSRWMQDDTGHEILSNAGIQKLMADGLKYRDIQSAPKPIAAKPLPPVQRPGTSKPQGSIVSERHQALNRKPELTIKEATELYELQMQASSRRRAS